MISSRLVLTLQWVDFPLDAVERAMDNAISILGFDDEKKHRDTYINSLQRFNIGGRPIQVDCKPHYRATKEAIEQWGTQKPPPAAVILDIRASGWTTEGDEDEDEAGFSLCKQIRNTPKWERVLIIFISSGDMDMNLVYREQFLGVDFVAKNEKTVDILRHKIQSHLYYMGQLGEFSIGAIRVNLQRFTVTVFEKTPKLSRREYRLINQLTSDHPNCLNDSEIAKSACVREEDLPKLVFRINEKVRALIGNKNYKLIEKDARNGPYRLNENPF